MSKLRIVALSDTHGTHEQVLVPEGDILIHAGDFMVGGLDFVEIINFNRWLGRLPHPRKIVIAGNHDIYFEAGSSLARSMLTNATYLENSRCKALGLEIWGSPYTPLFNDWAFMRERGEPLRRIWSMIPDRVDILVTHGPPWGVLDNFEDARIGDRDLLEEVSIRNIPHHIFGHCHPGHGQVNLDGRWFHNVAVLDPDFKPTLPPTVFDIEVPEDRCGFQRLSDGSILEDL